MYANPNTHVIIFMLSPVFLKNGVGRGLPPAPCAGPVLFTAYIVASDVFTSWRWSDHSATQPSTYAVMAYVAMAYIVMAYVVRAI